MCGFDALEFMSREIMKQGFDERTACHYAALIGDTPCTDREDRLVVREGGKVIDRIKWLDETFGPLPKRRAPRSLSQGRRHS